MPCDDDSLEHSDWIEITGLQSDDDCETIANLSIVLTVISKRVL